MNVVSSFSISPNFCHGDLVFLSSKVDLHIHYSDQRLGPFDVIEKADLKFYKLKHHRGCIILFVCNCDLLSKASNLDVEIDPSRRLSQVEIGYG